MRVRPAILLGVLGAVHLGACGRAVPEVDDSQQVVDSGPSDTDDSRPGPDTAPAGVRPVAVLLTADRLSLVGQPVVVGLDVQDGDGDAVTVAWTSSGAPARLVDARADGVVVVPGGVGTLRVQAVPSDAVGAGLPVTVTLTVSALAAGADHGLGLRADGGLVAWGENSRGSLGDGTRTSRIRAVPVCAPGAADCVAAPFEGAVALAAGGLHSLALLADGRVVAWGAGDVGQLGDGGTEDRLWPVPVCAPGASDCAAEPLRGVVAVAAGEDFSLALRADGTVVGWGANDQGQLARAPGAPQPTPVELCASGDGGCAAPLADVVAVSAGAGFALGLRADGSVVSWGRDTWGQLGGGGTVAPPPVRVCAPGAASPCAAGLVDVLAVAAGSTHAVALRRDGTAVAWGRNADGELAVETSTTCDGLVACARAPVAVCGAAGDPCPELFGDLGQVVAGLGFSTALRKDGTVWSWGANQETQLGDGTSARRRTPVRVCGPAAARPCTVFLDEVAGVASGSFHTLALRTDGSVWGWGDNPFVDIVDQLPLTSPVPARLGGW